MKSFKKEFVTILLFILVSTSGFSQIKKSKSYAKDVSSVQNILTAYYDCISGPIGEKRDFARLRNLFDPEARLIYSHWNQESTKASNLIFKTLDEFIDRMGYLDKKGFYEHEVSNKIHTFSSVTQVFSTYKFRVEDKSIPDGQGITSYEIFYDGERYWILSMFWAAEDAMHKIPKKYLD
ncbi:MAG: hypothetical protein JXR05_13765 [Flavobacteriaceae bacterium]